MWCRNLLQEDQILREQLREAGEQAFALRLSKNARHSIIRVPRHPAGHVPKAALYLPERGKPKSHFYAARACEVR